MSCYVPPHMRSSIDASYMTFAQNERFWNNKVLPNAACVAHVLVMRRTPFKAIVSRRFGGGIIHRLIPDVQANGGRVMVSRDHKLGRSAHDMFEVLVHALVDGRLDRSKIDGMLLLAGQVEVWFNNYDVNVSAILNDVTCITGCSLFEAYKHADGDRHEQIAGHAIAVSMANSVLAGA